MKVLVLGGTGAMGTHLVDILSEMGGAECVVTSRSKRQSHKAEYVMGNAHDESFLRPLLSRCLWDAIIDFMVYTTDEFAQRAELLLCATRHYVYLSSSRVYADSKEPIKEDSPRLLDICEDKEYLATDEYALAKARQEDILKKSGKRNWTIIRPYITFSEIRLQLSPMEKEYWLYRALQGKTIVFSRDIANKFTTLTYGHDVAKGIAAIIGKETALGEAFHITANDSYLWSDILEVYRDAIEKVTGVRPKVCWTDKWRLGLGGSALQVKWDRLYDRRFDNSKISRFIDTSTFKPIKSTLHDCIFAFMETPSFGQISWVSEAKKDGLTGEWENVWKIKGIKNKVKYLIGRFGVCMPNKHNE